MANQQYDLPEKVVKLFRIREAERKKTKAHFMKLITNPHRTIEDTQPFDSQVFRFSATQAYRYEFYKSTPRTSMVFMCVYILPILIPLYIANKIGSKDEEEIRSGRVAYKDRYLKTLV